MSADSIYGAQNKQIHMALGAIGMPYSGNRDYWIGILRDRFRSDVAGLSELTLGERRAFLADLKRQGAKVYAAWVPPHLEDWCKGDGDDGYLRSKGKANFPGRPADKAFEDWEKGRMLKKIEAMLAEAKRPWSYVHSMAKHMFGVDRVEWCQPLEIHSIVAALVKDAKRHGRYPDEL